MNDKDKSKDQLISELAAARRKISRLEGIITAGQMESQIFHWALESAPNAFLMLDKAGDITMVNKIAEQLFGYERGTMTGKAFDSLLSEASRERYRQCHAGFFSKVAQSGACSCSDFYGLRRDASEFPVRICVNAIQTKAGIRMVASIVDISETVHSAKALKENEERFRLFVQHAPTAVAMLDCDMKYILTSKRWLTDYHLDNSVIGKSHYEVFPEILKMPHWLEIHKRCLAGAVEKCEEDKFVRSDGSVEWLRWEILPWHKNTGEVGGIIMFTENVTTRKKAEELVRSAYNELESRVRERTEELGRANQVLEQEIRRHKKTEAALRESESYNRNLFDQSPIGLALCRMDGALVDVNPAYAKIIGRTVEECLKLTYWDITPQKYAVQEEAQLESLKTTGRYGPYEKEYIHKDGHTVPVRLQGLNIEKDGKKFIWSSIEDITVKKKAEEEVRKARAFLDSIVENIPDMIFVKEAKELRFVRMNKAGEELLGYSRDELIGKNDYDFFPKQEADFFTAKDRAVLAGKEVVDIEEESIHTRRKGVRILHTKKVPLYDKEGQPLYLLGISEDITEKKMVQKAIIQKTEQLARSKVELEQLELFAFSATHDLQEPLLKMIFYSDFLEKEVAPQLDAKGREYLQKICAGAYRMLHIMEQLRELSRIGMAEKPFEKINLESVLHEVVSDLDMRISEAGARVEMSSLPLIEGDKTQMRQLFQNLISNALKFRRPGGVTPRVVIEGRSAGQGMAEILVEDNGIGFDEKYLDRIFKPFQRLHGANEYEGSGIGLAICQKIVLRHKGGITAKSAPGKGTVFIISLPMYNDSKETAHERYEKKNT